MSTKSRLLGRDVQIRMAFGGVPLTTITAIKSFTFEPKTRILEEQFLGEVANRQDEIFDSVGGSFVIHPESPDIFVFQKAIVDRAIARRANELQATISFRVTFPSGQLAKFSIPNVVFGPMPLNFGGRDTYADIAVSYAADKYSLTTA